MKVGAAVAEVGGDRLHGNHMFSEGAGHAREVSVIRSYIDKQIGRPEAVQKCRPLLLLKSAGHHFGYTGESITEGGLGEHGMRELPFVACRPVESCDGRALGHTHEQPLHLCHGGTPGPRCRTTTYWSKRPGNSNTSGCHDQAGRLTRSMGVFAAAARKLPTYERGDGQRGISVRRANRMGSLQFLPFQTIQTDVDDGPLNSYALCSNTPA
jgi:hypothetical protein